MTKPKSRPKKKAREVKGWGCISEPGLSRICFRTRSEAYKYLNKLCFGTPYRRCFKVIRVSIKEIK